MPAMKLWKSLCVKESCSPGAFLSYCGSCNVQDVMFKMSCWRKIAYFFFFRPGLFRLKAESFVKEKRGCCFLYNGLVRQCYCHKAMVVSLCQEGLASRLDLKCAKSELLYVDSSANQNPSGLAPWLVGSSTLVQQGAESPTSWGSSTGDIFVWMMLFTSSTLSVSATATLKVLLHHKIVPFRSLHKLRGAKLFAEWAWKNYRNSFSLGISNFL